MSNKSKTAKRRRLTKPGSYEINPINGHLQYNTPQYQYQDAIKIIYERDIDFVRIPHVYKIKDGSLVVHSNWLRSVGLPDLTLLIKDNQIIQAIPENQDEWSRRRSRLTYKDAYRDLEIAYLEIKRDSIRQALESNHD